MPAICIFYGIIIRMYNEKGGKHQRDRDRARRRNPRGQRQVPQKQAKTDRRLDGDPPRGFGSQLAASFRRSKVFQNSTAAIIQQPAPTCGHTAHIRS